MVPNPSLARTPARPSPATPNAAAGSRSAVIDADEIRWQTARRDRLRAAGALCATGLMFIRFSAIHETISAVLGFNTYLIYVLAVPAGIAWILSGGFRRTFRPGSPIVYWTAFTAWMVLATPFSFWLAAGVDADLVYLRTVLPLAILVAGLPVTFTECRRLAYAVALAVPVIIVTARLFVNERDAAQGRVASDLQGTISNPNDIAGVLVVTLPFVLFIAIRPGTLMWIRAAAGLLLAAGLYTILHTGSRGAMVGGFAAFLMILIRANGRQRIALLAAGCIALVVSFAALPDMVVQRLFSFRAGSENVSEEAIQSQETRLYLLQRSLEFTATHPIFGVGPGNFMYYEDFDSREQGMRKGSWHVPHNTYTQVSAECGIPALILYIVAIGLTFRTVGRVHKACKKHPEMKEFSDLAFCFSVALFGFCVTIFNLPFSYHAYLPMLGGFSFCLLAVTQRELKHRGLLPEPVRPRNGAPALVR